MFDSQGYPAIVSFYQWGADDAGQDAVLNSEYREIAVRQASIQADRQIAEFLAGNVNYDRNSEIGRELERAAERLPDNYVAQRESAISTIDAMRSIVRRQARVDALTGLYTLDTWGQRHPVSNKMVFGVIRVWSAASDKGTCAIRDQRPAQPSASSPPGVPPSVTKGRELVNRKDF